MKNAYFQLLQCRFEITLLKQVNLFVCYLGLNAQNLATLHQYAFFPTKKAG